MPMLSRQVSDRSKMVVVLRNTLLPVSRLVPLVGSLTELHGMVLFYSYSISSRLYGDSKEVHSIFINMQRSEILYFTHLQGYI